MLGARGRFGHAHSAVVLTGVDMVDQESIDRINILEESDRAVENSNGQRRPLARNPLRAKAQRRHGRGVSEPGTDVGDGSARGKSHDGNVCRVEAGGRRLGKATTNGPIGRHKVTRPTSKRPAESGIVAPSTLSR
jgi:hypothetical protein